MAIYCVECLVLRQKQIPVMVFVTPEIVDNKTASYLGIQVSGNHHDSLLSYTVGCANFINEFPHK